MPKMWPFGRRGAKAAKLKEGRSAVVTEGKPRPAAAPASAQLPPNSDALRKKRPSSSSSGRRFSSRRHRPHYYSRSTTTTTPAAASMRDAEKSSSHLPPVHPAFAKDADLLPPSSSVEDITALPAATRLEQSPHLRPIVQHHVIPYDFHAGSHASLPTPRERGKLQRPQSLRKPAIESALVPRKSSKRRQHDSVREEEIRAMSLSRPQKRPAGNSGGGMLRRDSKKVKGPLNRHFERPISNVSLPLEESIHSSMSGNSETRAWRVSALDMFSPRPTVRCSVGSQYYYTGAGPSPTSYQSKKDHRLTASRDGKEENKSKTIDDLADTLDAGALRDILERDKRRRERKRKADDERLRRRLERRAEKQKAAEQAATAPATRRKAASGPVGLGIAQDTPTPMEDIQPTTTSTPPPPPSPPQAQPQAQRLDLAATVPTFPENNQLPTPLQSPMEEPMVANAQAVRYARASPSSPSPPSHARGPSNVSQMPELLSETVARETAVQSVESVPEANASGSLHPVVTTDTAATSKRGSRRRSSEGKRMGIIASFFRRRKRNSQDQARETPSEVSFSNTSRESMARHPPPTHLVATQPSQPSQPIQIRRPSSVPRRTMSKFREDLPELPISPPDSRVQSPEVLPTSASAIAARRRSQPPSDVRVHSSSPRLGGRTDSPVSPGMPAANIMSQSLASVDSEASWLSGKPMKRKSNSAHLRSSAGSSSAYKRNDEFNASYEELGIPDDEYFRRLSPQPDERRRSGHSADMLARKASSTAMAALGAAESDDEDAPRLDPNSEDEELVKSSVGRQPTIVHRQARIKSREGLLSYFEADKPAPGEKAFVEREQESPTSDGEPAIVQRALSVDLGKKHSRQVSARSAKLLDIPAKRSSVDRNRSTSNSPSPLPPE